MILKRDQPELYQKTIGRFESHWEVRQRQPEVASLIRYVTAFIRSRLGQSWVKGEDVEHAYGVLKTNGVGGAGGCYLYPKLSLVSHSCLPNTEVKDRPGRQITLVALTDIKSGEELTWNYSNTLLPRDQRASHLSSTWLFQCRCARCQDPEELGLNYSAQQCSCGGHFNPGDQGDTLACTACNLTINRLEVRREEQDVLKTISELGPEGLQEFLRQISEDSRYHRTHHVVTRASIR